MAVLSHIVHLGRDLRELNRWYEDTFGVVGFFGWPEPDYLESERRLASMFMLGDVCIETVAPADPDDTATALGRALARDGPQLYSVAFREEDLVTRGRRLLEMGVRIGDWADVPERTRFFVPSPRDMAGLRVEFLDVPFGDEPSGGLILDHVTAHVDDLTTAAETLVRVLGGQQVAPGCVRFGGVVIELCRGVRSGWAGLTFSTARDDDVALDVHGAQFTLRQRVPSG